jgi:C-3',4' desaturase CrtD
MKPLLTYDVAVIGCGIAGMATALRLQSKGLSTVIIEAHGQPGGCAGYFRRKGFVFDVGATTLVDFDEGGVGGEFFKSINLPIPASDLLDYILWLPDKSIHLYHQKEKWAKERLDKLGNTPNHIRFWKFMDDMAEVFWNASRRGIKLPVQNLGDITNAIQAIGFKNLHWSRYISWTMMDGLRKFDLQDDTSLKAVLSMLIEDTVHSSLDKAPLINSALGITIRGAGLRRAKGGMKGMWDDLVRHYKYLGGNLMIGNKVIRISEHEKGFEIVSSKGLYYARKVVSAIPSEVTARIVPERIKIKMQSYVERDRKSLGSAIVVFLGVPESEVMNQEVTHHQLLYDYQKVLGNGNNMFISISSPGDLKSAPAGYRSVMLSTHCELSDWDGLSEEDYEVEKKKIGEQLLSLARKIYPDLGKAAVIYEVGTPRTYYKYTGRPKGAVGGVRQTFENSNFNALPHHIGVKNFRLAGDSTWPGLGTVACILGSRIVAKQILK